MSTSTTIPRSVHLVGIGGAHMSAIARILLSWGHAVSGSDLRQTSVTDAVEALGARIVIGPHAAANVCEVDLVVTTSAAVTSNPELAEAQRRGIPVIKRAEMVARLMAGKVGIGVAGCHGKSTTSGMVAFILREAGYDPTYLIGAELSDLGSNAAAGAGEHVVVEADEYDRAFLSYHPQVALVTNVEADHLDYYKTWEAIQQAFRQFASQVEPGGTLVLCANDAEALSLREYAPKGVNVVTYAVDERVEWRASEVSTRGLGQSFTVYHHGEPVRRFEIALPILHNVQNALGAIIVCHTLGLSMDEIAAALSRYGGVRRRFELVGEAAGVLVFDDYAHHPTEIADTAAAAKVHFPGRRIVAMFQPHTYARSRYLLEGFRSCFRDFDRLFILETYAAREAIADGMTGAQLAAEITHPVPGYAETFESAAAMVAAELKPGDVFFTVGAGDVDCVGPMVLAKLRSEGDGVSFRLASEFEDAAERLFDAQKARIMALLPKADIQHIGSTAVDGALTKGDLDINVRVQKADFDAALAALRALYTVNQPQNWSQDFASFKDDHGFDLPLGVQLTAIGTEADDFVFLRDHLNSRPDLVARVNELKSQYQNGSMDAYRAAKADLYERIRNAARR